MLTRIKFLYSPTSVNPPLPKGSTIGCSFYWLETLSRGRVLPSSQRTQEVEMRLIHHRLV